MPPQERVLIRNARVVRPERILEGDVLVEDGRIASVGPGLPVEGASVVDADGLLLLPGFIELHCHGGALFDATCGRYLPEQDTFDRSEQAYADGLSDFLQHLARHGATRAVAATAAAPPAMLDAALGLLARHLRASSPGRRGCRLEGVFIEGTFIKREDCAGAQNPEFFQAPTPESFERLNDAARGTIRYVNVVPEYGESAVALTRSLTARGVLVGAGHTKCPADQYLRLVQAGMRVAVHFTNGPTGSSFKPFHGGDAVEAVLSSDEVYAELITDGYHVDPRYVLDIVRRKGHERIIIVTDATFAAGAQNVGEFTFTGQTGCPSKDGRFLRLVGKENTLFGSVMTPDVAFSNVVSWMTREMPGIWNRRHRPLDTDEAVVRASRMISRNPAEVLDLYADDGSGEGTGRIEAGKQADLVLAELSGEPGAYRLSVRRTFVGGEPVHLAA